MEGTGNKLYGVKIIGKPMTETPAITMGSELEKHLVHYIYPLTIHGGMSLSYADGYAAVAMKHEQGWTEEEFRAAVKEIRRRYGGRDRPEGFRYG